jgi:hypothetical protein
MLASRIAHASAKGRSQQIRATQASVGIYEAHQENFSKRFPSKAALLMQSRPALSGKDAHVMIRGTLPICSEESGGIFGSGS